jgi:hypothetical protein
MLLPIASYARSLSRCDLDRFTTQFGPCWRICAQLQVMQRIHSKVPDSEFPAINDQSQESVYLRKPGFTDPSNLDVLSIVTFNSRILSKMKIEALVSRPPSYGERQVSEVPPITILRLGSCVLSTKYLSILRVLLLVSDACVLSSIPLLLSFSFITEQFHETLWTFSISTFCIELMSYHPPLMTMYFLYIKPVKVRN